MREHVSLNVLNDGPCREGLRAAAYEKKEKCGVMGVWIPPNAPASEPTPSRDASPGIPRGAPTRPASTVAGTAGAESAARQGLSVAMLAYLGLYAQQHRGQEAAGIAVSNGEALSGVTGTGLVPEVFDADTIAGLERDAAQPARAGRAGAGEVGRGAIGHTRYSTAGGSLACNAQPLLESYVGGQVALAHNGNLVNAEALRRAFERQGHLFHTTSDTEVVIHLLASPQQQETPDPVAATLRHLQGAFSLVFLFADRIEAARDPWGWRPLVIGRRDDGALMVASETVALDVCNAALVREVEPGEIVTLSARGLESRRFAPAAERGAMCVFEHVYFANPASTVFGQNVQVTRESLGATLAKESPVAADYVIPMPDSGRSAAIGYARASGVPLREAIVPNRYVGRTFIKPSQAERTAAVRLKLNVIGEIVRDKRLIIVDDSIVRGTTTRAKVDQIRQAGAREIHLRISCPPIRHPCFFGVDFATRDQLIASGRSIEEIRVFLGVDSLAYLSLDGLLACMCRPGAGYCTACYSGDYRIDVAHPTTEEVASSQLRMF